MLESGPKEPIINVENIQAVLQLHTGEVNNVDIVLMVVIVQILSVNALFLEVNILN